MKQDKATTQVHEICRHCGDPYTVKERIRIYGDNPFMAGYCSAGCYTEGILMKADPSPSIPVNEELDIRKCHCHKKDVNIYSLEFSDGTYFESDQSVNAPVTAQRLSTSYNETWVKGYNPAAMEELYKALEDLINRADRCRNILQTTNGNSKGNWGMLDTEAAKTALQNAKTIKP